MRQQLSVTAPDTSTGSIQGKMTQPAPGRVAISIGSAKTFQTILGFGGSVSIPGYDELSPAGKDQWWQFLKDYNLLIQREYPVRHAPHARHGQLRSPRRRIAALLRRQLP